MGCPAQVENWPYHSSVGWFPNCFVWQAALSGLARFVYRSLLLCWHPYCNRKNLWPSNNIIFCWNWIRFSPNAARLPLDKLNGCSTLLLEFLHRKKATLRGVQSLTGLLNFACPVIVPGRAFRLIDLTAGIQWPHHLIRLSKDVKEDLKVWQSFLANFNGQSFFLEETWYSSTRLDLYTDTSGALGFDAIFGSRWCFGKWPASWSYRNIAMLEFYPNLLSLYLWGHAMCNHCILFFTDNESLVHIINKQLSKD